ncbi:hypothetical protein LCGC14_2717530 [marine sediment metagenome]|uniref:Uncharacterized protein n=1 Tax=marine sediment metagenome TaxID=412755 RepID=A0A0F8ZB09_9ZZZZ
MAFRNWKQELADPRPPREIPWRLIRGTGMTLVAMGVLACTALWVYPGYLLAKPWQRPGPPPPQIALVFSSDIQGNLEPCGCTEQRWGGLARAAGYLQSIREPATVLAFDVGDMTAGPLQWQQLGWRQCLRAMAAMGYMAVNLGAREIALSAEDLRRVVVDGFYQLQQATFASPKRKSIQAYQDFQDGGGDLYVPTPEQKEMFKEAAQPVYEWFKQNVDGGEAVFDAMTASVEKAEQRLDATRAAEIQ